MKNLITLLFCSLPAIINAQTSISTFDIAPGTVGANPKATTVYNNKLYFSANRQLAYTDGVAAPVVMNFSNTGVSAGDTFSRFAVAANRLYVTRIGGNYTDGEVFYYDGGSDLVRARQQFLFLEEPRSTSHLFSFNNKIYCKAFSQSAHYKLWQFDPATNTARMADSAHNSIAGEPEQLIAYKNKIYFCGLTTTGHELCCYDPAKDSISVIKHASVNDLYPSNLYVYDNTVFMMSIKDKKLYTYDGNNINVIPGSYAVTFYTAGFGPIMGSLYNYVYFAAEDAGSHIQLFSYDVLSHKVALVHTINPSGNAFPEWFVTYANKLYFKADNGTNGAELWVYDGKNTPTMVADINPGAGSSDFSYPIVFNNSLYFTATEPSKGNELYKLTDALAGISSISFSGKVTIAPNPSQGDFKININLPAAEKLNVAITDISGRQVYQTGLKNYTQGDNPVNISMASQPAGNYFYHISNEAGAGCASGKLVKE